MKKINFILAIIFLTLSFLFIFKNDALAVYVPPSKLKLPTATKPKPGQCEPPCNADEKCSWNNKCVPRGGGNPTQPPAATATPIPTATPRPLTATPVPACPKKAQGDADCDGNVTFKDYFYYVAKKAGGTLPTTVNVDFNGSGTVDAADRAIVVKTLKP